MKDLSQIISLLHLIALYQGGKNYLHNSQYNIVFDAWNMGKNKISDSLKKDYLNLNSEQISKVILSTAKEVKEILSQEGLYILLQDIKKIIKCGKEAIASQFQIVKEVENIWEKELIQYKHDTTHLGKSFKLTVPFGIGFLFYIAIKTDKNIDKSELIQVRRNLEVWDVSTARLIIESLNFAESAVDQGTFLNTFSISEDSHHIAQEEEKLLDRVIAFLKENISARERVIVFQQITQIIKADGQVREKERQLREKLLKAWEDIEALL